ncbi:MAG: KamA family protein [Bacteroidales bacterium]|nr:KamA family protein [Bacteroidales bacterium]
MFREENIKKEIKPDKDSFHDSEEIFHCREIVREIISENPKLSQYIKSSGNFDSFIYVFRSEVMAFLKTRPLAFQYYENEQSGRDIYNRLGWQAVAAIRVLDYIDHEGKSYSDMNLRGRKVTSSPLMIVWKAIRDGHISANPDFFEDFLMLMRQYNGILRQNVPGPALIKSWMKRHPTGLNQKIIEVRNKNKDRIIRTFIRLMEEGRIVKTRYSFEPCMSFAQKYQTMLEWWNTKTFHLHFAVRTPGMLNELLGHTLPESTMNLLNKAGEAGIPIFVNPYYLSLLNVDAPEYAKGADAAIRDYIFVSGQLVNEFGHIIAWEKEDVVEPGKPNAAGWLLPNKYNIHRRYPEVAILIPDTIGRSCGGLCVSCQRMYDFQNGRLNFNLQKLLPDDTWWNRLPKLLNYFENDSQLRDILITGGDALMSSDKSLERILKSVLNMAIRKKEANRQRPGGEKYAEILRVRLGTRLPVYLPQRITPELVTLLKDFKANALKAGIKQFFIQTHFESAMEVTPEAARGIRKLISAGWTVTNQLVFTAAASKRGHTARLRKTLNQIGVLSYYTFTVKGYAENAGTFANNARAMQEQKEEKYVGRIPGRFKKKIEMLPAEPEAIKRNIRRIMDECDIPFLATDRNVLNLPGVGKSMTFRTIGITRDGRRILEFDHDHTRNHSPIIEKMGRVVIIESRSVSSYLRKMEEMGENNRDYHSIWGYSMGETEPVFPVYNYPGYDFDLTPSYTNLEVR